MHTNEHRRRNPSISVVCNASVFSLISCDVSDVQHLSFKDLTTFNILPKIFIGGVTVVTLPCHTDVTWCKYSFLNKNNGDKKIKIIPLKTTLFSFLL